jgi:hypothetical protein
MVYICNVEGGLFVMLKPRELLEDKLNILLSKYAPNPSVKDKMQQLFVLKNIPVKDATDILTKRTDIRTLNEFNLYLTTKALFESIEFESDRTNINPGKFFTELEIDQYDKHKESAKDVVGFPIVLKNTEMIMDDYFTTRISIQKLVKFMSSRIIKYNPKTQRKLKTKERNGEIIEEIDIDTEQVKEITNSILKGDQFPNYLILNVLQDGYDEINFTKDKQADHLGTLKINSGEIDVLDGFHRMLASTYAVQQNPNVNFSWGIIVVNYDESKARRFMVQEQKGRKMNKEYIASLDINRLENLAVKKINDNTEYDIAGKIVPTDGDIAIGNGWTKFSIMEDAILDCFKEELSSKFEVNKIANKILKGFDQIIGANIDEFVKQDLNSVINHKNIYPMYVYLSQKVVGTKDWEDVIYNVINSIDFSINNQLWNDIGVLNKLNKDASKTVRIKLYNLIDEKLKECI